MPYWIITNGGWEGVPMHRLVKLSIHRPLAEAASPTFVPEEHCQLVGLDDSDGEHILGTGTEGAMKSLLRNLAARANATPT